MTNDNTDLFSFGDSDMTDVDFFSIEEEQEQEEGKTEKTQKPEDKSKVEEEVIEEDENLFDEENEEEEEEEEEGGDKSKQKPEENIEIQDGDSITTLNLLKERGFLEYELEEGEELTDDRAAEILEDSIDNLFEDRIEEIFENVPDIVKEINKFVIKGGDINTYLQTIAVQNSTGLTEDMDLDDETNQELVIRQGLLGEGYDDEYITAQIDFLKDSKRMKSHTDIHFKKWNDKRKLDEEKILKSQEKIKLADKNQRRELKSKVTTFLKDTESVSGFSVTKQDRKILPNYMSDRSIKLENGNQITGMQRDLMRVLNSPTGSVQIAKLLKAASQEGELNFDEIKKETETKVAKKVRENVRRGKKSIVSRSEGPNKKSLADLFD